MSCNEINENNFINHYTHRIIVNIFSLNEMEKINKLKNDIHDRAIIINSAFIYWIVKK